MNRTTETLKTISLSKEIRFPYIKGKTVKKKTENRSRKSHKFKSSFLYKWAKGYKIGNNDNNEKRLIVFIFDILQVKLF